MILGFQEGMKSHLLLAQIQEKKYIKSGKQDTILQDIKVGNALSKENP